MLPIKILRNDVFHALTGLNPRKAYGPDGVPPIVLRNCASMLAPCLVKLFQLCLSTSILPSCWKFAYIQPVPKKGDLSLCAERITEVIVSGMEAYIPHSFSRPKPSKPWFNTACSCVIYDREVAHKRYLSLPSPKSHTVYLPEIMPSLFFNLPKTPSFTESVKIFPNITHLETSGI